MATTNILTMEIKQAPLEDLTPYPGNPRRGNLDLIKTSLASNGQYRPLVVQRSTGYIIAGNNTYLAAREMGWDRIAAQYLDVDDAAARRILAVDNKANDEADYDNQALALLLADIEDLEGTGFTDDEMQDLLEGVTADEADEDPFPGAPEPPAASAPAPATSAPEPGPAGAPSAPSAPEPEPGTADGAPAAPPAPPAVAEMIIAFTPEDRNEAAQLVAAARSALGEETKTADIILRSLRCLVAACDARNDPGATVTVDQLLKAAS